MSCRGKDYRPSGLLSPRGVWAIPGTSGSFFSARLLEAPPGWEGLWKLAGPLSSSLTQQLRPFSFFFYFFTRLGRC